MLVELEGGCRVVGLRYGTPRRAGDLTIWNHFASTLSLRVLELHGRATLRNDDRDEVLFVLGEERSLYLPAGEDVRLAGDVGVAGEAQVATGVLGDGQAGLGDRRVAERGCPRHLLDPVPPLLGLEPLHVAVEECDGDPLDTEELLGQAGDAVEPLLAAGAGDAELGQRAQTLLLGRLAPPRLEHRHRHQRLLAKGS